ncbi:MAG: hypothetical protein ACXVRJ_03190 [Gaiellaceae bacterium]
MDELDLQLDDIVLFELPSVECSAAFTVQLRSRWPGWTTHDPEGWLFAAELVGGEGELARLLREAQDLLEELGVGAIRFYLDGRVYVLEPQRRPIRAVDTVSSSF